MHAGDVEPAGVSSLPPGFRGGDVVESIALPSHAQAIFTHNTKLGCQP